jgi:hypothetical protein
MRVKTFHSAVGVILLLVGIALISRYSPRGKLAQASPSSSPLTASTPVYAATTSPAVSIAPPAGPRPRINVRQTARAVVLSTVPMAPVLEAVTSDLLKDGAPVEPTGRVEIDNGPAGIYPSPPRGGPLEIR